jgi:hypothetical protein
MKVWLIAVMIFLAFMGSGTVTTLWASQRDAAVMELRLQAIRQLSSPIRLSNGERIDTTTYRGQMEALEALSTGSDADRWQLADAYYRYAWRQAGGNREMAQTWFQSMTGLVSIRAANQLFDQCAKRAPTVAATETAKTIQAAEAAKAAQQVKAAEAAKAAHDAQMAKEQARQAAAKSWQQAREQLPQGWAITCETERIFGLANRPGARDSILACTATRGELHVILRGSFMMPIDVIKYNDEFTLRVSIKPVAQVDVSRVWFDNDSASPYETPYQIWLAQGRNALAVIERMQTASVLHYSYRSKELPQGENTDISVEGFAAAWKNLRETFNQELKWRYAAFQKEQQQQQMDAERRLGIRPYGR